MAATPDTIIERQASATSSAIAKFAGIEDVRTVHTLVLAGLRQVAMDLSGAAPPGSAPAPSITATPPTAAQATAAPARAGDTAAAAKRTTTTPPSTMVVPFGHGAGRQLGMLCTVDVRWFEAAIRRALVDPEKERFLSGNRVILAKIEAELARRGEQSLVAPAGAI